MESPLLGPDSGYTVQYTPLYLTVYTDSSPNTDTISYIREEDLFRPPSRSGYPPMGPWAQDSATS